MMNLRIINTAWFGLHVVKTQTRDVMRKKYAKSMEENWDHGVILRQRCSEGCKVQTMWDEPGPVASGGPWGPGPPCKSAGTPALTLYRGAPYKTNMEPLPPLQMTCPPLNEPTLGGWRVACQPKRRDDSNQTGTNIAQPFDQTYVIAPVSPTAIPYPPLTICMHIHTCKVCLIN